MYDSDGAIKERLRGGVLMTKWKRKVHLMRKILAGDPYAIEGLTSGSVDEMMEAYRDDWGEYPDILVTDFIEGRSNRPLKAFKVLVQRVSYRAPEVEMEEVSDELSTLNSIYLVQRSKECETVSQMELALWDSLCGGLGWVFVGLRGGKPVCDYADTMDVLWDPHARFVDEARWQSRRVRGPLRRFVGIYGPDAFRTMLREDSNTDRPVSLTEYYDIEGEDGQGQYCVVSGSDGSESEIVVKSANPYRDAMGMPMLPGTSMSFFTLPSVRLPIGILEMIIPNYKAVMEAENTIREVTKRMKTQYMMKRGAIADDNSREAFMDGEVGGVVEVNDLDGIRELPAGEVAQTVMAWFQQNDQEIIEHAGINPYATGGRVEGVSYAAEVNAIQGNADLTSAWVAKSNAEFWQRMFTKFIAVGRAYDDMPIQIRVGDDLLEFDRSDAVMNYLKADAPIVVREQTMMFKPKDQLVAEAAQNMEIAAKLVGFYPEAIAKETENWLRARGIKDIKGYMAPPQQMPLPGMDGMNPEVAAANVA